MYNHHMHILWHPTRLLWNNHFGYSPAGYGESLCPISGHETIKTQEKMLVDVLQKLPSINYLQSHEEASRKVIGESGQWFLKNERFEDWKNGKFTGFLSLGDPGVGKTCLVSIVISHLQKLSGPSRVAYLYMSHQKAESQTLTHIVSILLRQLLSSYDSLPDSLVGLYNQLSLDQGPRLNMLVSALAGLCTDPKFRTYIVLDALDECKPSYQTEFMQILEQLLAAQAQLLATSRPASEDIGDLFDKPYCIKYPITASSSDISSFLKQKLDTKEAFRTILDDNFKKEMIQTIDSRSQGVFLIAAMQIEHILTLTKKTKIKEVLSKFPKDLDTNFSITLDRIKAQSEDYLELALSVMTILAYVYEPLTVKGLCYALATELKSSRFEVDNLTTSNMIIEACCGLVTLQGENLDDPVIGFYHLSALEYFQKYLTGSSISPQKTLALICLTYLSIEELIEDDVITLWLDAVGSKDAAIFYGYAARYGGAHAAEGVDDELMELIKLLISKKDHAIKWSRVDYAEDYSTEMTLHVNNLNDNNSISILHIMARFGFKLNQLLPHISHHILDTVNDKAAWTDETPLMLASRYNHIDVVEYLLNAPGIDINAKDKNEFTALGTAIRSGHTHM
ncbi:hypothetical protein BDN72DRAFT_965138 [Pluteus cervinus]|uniref:Uncharacterized protein n=1 Tax=Pluteus cervinus TaxID=181527 RepID=A0ACD3A751_9AGAR|nr:hypothetical protein BDN72DRAFT_965138 [Pluteus cervinus]